MENKNKNKGFDFDDTEEVEETDDYRPEYSDEESKTSEFDLKEDVESTQDGLEENKEVDLFSEEDSEEDEESTPIQGEQESGLEEDESEDEEESTQGGLEEESTQGGLEEVEGSEDSVLISKTKIALAKRLFENISENNKKLMNLFGGLLSPEDEERINISQIGEGILSLEEQDGGGKIIEGVFDGENMIGPDGKQYSVPSNYASKSKLVEGDLLKLTITPKGTFVYKQTKPIERRRVVGILEKTEDGGFNVISDDRKWKILTASVTYFKGGHGDETIILVPRESDSAWGAVENIVKNR